MEQLIEPGERLPFQKRSYPPGGWLLLKEGIQPPAHPRQATIGYSHHLSGNLHGQRQTQPAQIGPFLAFEFVDDLIGQGFNELSIVGSDGFGCEETRSLFALLLMVFALQVKNGFICHPRNMCHLIRVEARLTGGAAAQDGSGLLKAIGLPDTLIISF